MCLNIYQRKKNWSVNISFIHVPNFIKNDWFVNELSVFKVEKSVMWKIGFSRLSITFEFIAVYSLVSKNNNKNCIFHEKNRIKILKNHKLIALYFISDIKKTRDFPIFQNDIRFVFTFKTQIKQAQRNATMETVQMVRFFQGMVISNLHLVMDRFFS